LRKARGAHRGGVGAKGRDLDARSFDDARRHAPGALLADRLEQQIA
jgi:hypothetical protein